MNFKEVLEKGYRVHLINVVNDILIRFTGEGLSDEDIQKRMTCDLEKLEKEVEKKKLTYCAYNLYWN